MNGIEAGLVMFCKGTQWAARIQTQEKEKVGQINSNYTLLNFSNKLSVERTLLNWPNLDDNFSPLLNLQSLYAIQLKNITHTSLLLHIFVWPVNSEISENVYRKNSEF